MQPVAWMATCVAMTLVGGVGFRMSALFLGVASSGHVVSIAAVPPAANKPLRHGREVGHPRKVRGPTPAPSKPNLPTYRFKPIVDALPGGHIGDTGEEEFVETDGKDQPTP